MRPIARQSARLANSNRSRGPHVAKRKNGERQQAFHTSVQRQEPRSPNGQPDHHNSFNDKHEPHRRAENPTARHEQGAEEENTETKSTNDTRKHGMRRNLRQKRVNDVPKPPPIPEWFLQHNVKLFKDSPGLGVSKETGQVIRCIDTETGHTLFTVPYYEAWPATTPPPEKREGGRNKEQQSKFEQLPADNESVVESTDTSKQNHKTGKSSFEQNFFDHRYQLSKPASRQHQERDNKKLTDFSPPIKESQLESNSNPMRWIFLEAETGIRAALSLANDNQRVSSFASDRIDLSLQCPDPNSHDQMDEFVRDLARVVQADIIRLDANDFAELAEDYVGQGHDEPGSFSALGYDVFDGYSATSLRSNHVRAQTEEDEENEMDEDEEADEDEQDNVPGNNIGPFASLGDLTKALQSGRMKLGNAISARVVGIGIGGPQQGARFALPHNSSQSSMSQSSEMNRDDARLAALLDNLLDATKQKRASNQSSEDASNVDKRSEQRKSVFNKKATNDRDQGYQRLLRYWRSNPAFWLPHTAKSLVGYLGKAVQEAEPGTSAFTLASEPRDTPKTETLLKDINARTIVHVRDLRDLCNSRLGETIVHRLVNVVRKRRRAGEQIMIIGTTAQDVPGPIRLPGEQADDFPFRAMTVPPFFNFSVADDSEFEFNSSIEPQKSLSEPAYRRIMEINFRHLQSMLRRLRPNEQSDLLSFEARRQMNMPGMHFLTEKVLSLDQAQRLILIAIGLSQSHAIADVVKPIHVALAGFILTRSEHAESAWNAFRVRKQARKAKSDAGNGLAKDGTEGQSIQARVERLKKICNPHETRLLSGMVDPQNIKTAFADVHAPEETIEALKTLTTLSLLRPDAFKYGVLANDRLPGLLLYGPPGTGKTLLAKAVAKESKATVLEVSGAQIYEKYVGEGEKMVKAVFSLAKKLTPCVVFIDEADAIFGSRSNAGNRNTHREIINQFLREWDGMDDHGVFMMVASNRPFDLDDAVLRRLPRRLLVDLPVAQDRESILRIHLKNEDLDPSVSVGKLAEQTPFYSGSDLKNLSVAAALACVREENELASTHKDDKDFKLPDKRTLNLRHFEKALAEISASVSEDMSSLTAIRKFDEKYGDRRGRRKKAAYGFGVADGIIDEGAARVRQPIISPSSP